METPLTLNNARIDEFIKFCSRTKSTFGCYIAETAASIASNDAPYER